jgi:hypothetical protein
MRAASLSFAATTAMAVGGLAFAGAGSTGFGVASLEAVMLVGIAAVGAVVARREPQNPCGWLVCVIPASFAAAILGDRVYDQTADAAGQVQGAELIAPWIVSCVWIPAMLSIAAFAQLFPTGRPLTDNWRPCVWTAALAGPPLFVGTAFGGGALEDYPHIDNPVGAGGSLGTVVDVIGYSGFALLVLSVLGGLASLIVRFRRSTGVERQQLKWVMTAAPTFPVAFALPTDEVAGDELGFALLLALFLIACAVAVAILRYRLYDIDVVINRTLVYLALTGILAGISWRACCSCS